MVCSADRERSGPAHKNRYRIGRYQGNRQAPAGEQNAPMSRLRLERESVRGALQRGAAKWLQNYILHTQKGRQAGNGVRGDRGKAKRRAGKAACVRSRPQLKPRPYASAVDETQHDQFCKTEPRSNWMDGIMIAPSVSSNQRERPTPHRSAPN